MKKFIIYFCLGVAAVIIVTCFLVVSYGGSWVTARMEDYCARQFGSRPQFTEEAKIGLFPPEFMAGPLEWRVKTQNCEADIALEKITVALDGLTLLTGNFNIREINILNPVASITVKKTASTSKTDAKGTPAKGVTIGRVLVQNGKLKLRADNFNCRMENIKILAEDLKPLKGGDVKGDFSLFLPMDGSTEIESNVAFKSGFHYYDPNLTLRQTAVTMTFLKDYQTLSPLHINFEGALNLRTGSMRVQQGALGTPFGRLDLEGDLGDGFGAFKGIARLTMERGSNSVYISSPVAYAWPDLDLSDMALKVNDSTGEGKLSLTFSHGASPFTCKGYLKAGVINWKSEPDATSEKPGDKIQPMQLGAKPDLDLEVELAGFNYEKLSLNNIKLKILGKDGNYSAPGLDFNWEGGSVKAKAALFLPQWEWNFNSQGQKINFGKMLEDFGVKGFKDGQADFNAALKAQGQTPKEIASTLDGDGDFSVTGVNVELLEDVTRMLTVFGGNEKRSAGIAMTAPFHAHQGVVKFAPLTAKSVFISAAGSAVIDFPRQRLDSVIDFRLGKLSLPVSIKGPFEHISVGLDRHSTDH